MGIAKKILDLRFKKGISQEVLAENSGLNLRTIQRIEKEVTNPTGDSLKKIAAALNVSIDELIKIELIENKNYLKSLNLSALIFLIFPFLGIILPTILWLLKKGKIKDLDFTGKALLNFQITWNTFLILGICLVVFSIKTKIFLIGSGPIILFVIFMYLFNLSSIIVNSLRVIKDKKVFYLLKINFI